MRREMSDFSKKLLTLILPITFQQFMLALVSASDAFMLGMVSQDALSAASLAGQITFVENLFLAAMTIGLSMLSAQYWGKRDREAVERIFGYVTRISACRVNSASFGVRLWQEITVPFARRSIMAMGFPTMLLRPTTVQTLPSTGIS